MVRAVYDVTWDGGAGRAARNIYMMPESGTGGSWYVYGAQDCAVPAELAQGVNTEVPLFTPAAVEFFNEALETSPDPMTYDERLNWAQNAEYDQEAGAFQFLPQTHMEGAGCIVYSGYWAGTPHTGQNSLYIRFADGTQANLPLPNSGLFSTASPNTMTRAGNQFVYTVHFDTLETFDEDPILLHLAGTYQYTVDLTAKTVSLTVLDP